MIGTEYPSEMGSYKDGLTGRTVIQLTSEYQNYHLYFTENSFTLGDNEIYFLSSRPDNNRSHFNYFRMDLKTGIITQITDEPDGIEENGHTKTPDSQYLLYTTNHKKTLKLLETATGKITILYEERNPDFVIGNPSFSCDKRYVGFLRNEQRQDLYGDNYTGFTETMYSTKLSQVIVLPVAHPELAATVFTDTHWIGHLQFSPEIPTLVTYCHEGPWNYVQQRIWLLDIVTRIPYPCFRQEEDDSVGHEFWTRNNMVFLDNRRAGHDGTITKDKTQAILKEGIAKKEKQVPYVAFADIEGNIIRKIDLPYYCNHYSANGDNTLLVGDDVENLVLIDISGEKPIISPLCYHGTSWIGQITHCHPTWGWNNHRILFEAERDNQCNLYMVEI